MIVQIVVLSVISMYLDFYDGATIPRALIIEPWTVKVLSIKIPQKAAIMHFWIIFCEPTSIVLIKSN